MLHPVILYTRDLDRETDMPALCRTLGDTMLTLRDEAGAPVFSVTGTRVLAYPASHSAVADGERDCAYFNMRMAKGRSEAVRQRAGQALVDAARANLAPVLARRPIGPTLQIDEGHESFDGKFGNLHPLFGTS